MNIEKEIINHFYNVPVVVEKRFCSRAVLKLVVSDETGLVKKCDPEVFQIANDSWADEKMIKGLNSKMKKIARQFNPRLVGILHEIGHAKTVIGMNWDFNKQFRILVNNLDVDEIFAIRLYRKIPIENVADKWAINWLIENSELAHHWSQLLN